MKHMKNYFGLLLAPFLMSCTSVQEVPRQLGGQEPKVTPLMSKPLTNMPGKEGLMLLVEYGPGGADPVHRHPADSFVYVLEGSVIMQVEGGNEVILQPGQTFYEGPHDLHIVGRNASDTKSAKFVVFMVKDSGAPALIPVPTTSH